MRLTEVCVVLFAGSSLACVDVPLDGGSVCGPVLTCVRGETCVAGRCVEDIPAERPYGLIAHWTLDEATEDGFTDASGHGQTLRAVGEDFGLVISDGLDGGAVFFDNTGTYLVWEEPASGNNHQVTFSYWVHGTSGPGRQFVGVTFGEEGSAFEDWSDPVDQWDYTTQVPTLPDRWVHVAVSFDRIAGTLTMYVDGQDWFQGTPEVASLAGRFWMIGAAVAADTRPGFGIDDFRVYDRILDPEEIQMLAE